MDDSQEEGVNNQVTSPIRVSYDKEHVVEQPCEVETLMHGSEQRREGRPSRLL